MTSKFNINTLGEQTPWFGPALEGYHTVINANLSFLPPGKFEFIVWAWNNSGKLIGEQSIGIHGASETIAIDVSELFPLLDTQGGVIGILPNACSGLTPYFAMAFCTRFYLPNGLIAGVVNSGNAKNLNYHSRNARTNTYRMCSQQTFINETWRPLSWHANVSANPNYSTTLNASVMVFNNKGEKITAPNILIPPFGALLVDIDEIFANRLDKHLATTNGRGSLVVTADNGGAIGYHFMQKRDTLDLACDHTRPVWKYLNMSYGANNATFNHTISYFVKSSARYIRFNFLSR